MKMKKTSQLKKDYESICNEILDLFCEKQELENDGWVGDIVGGIVCLGDSYFDFSDIFLDITTEQPKGLILSWYFDNLEHEKHRINYYSYTKGLRVEHVIEQSKNNPFLPK